MFPPAPTFPPGHAAVTTSRLRYEDLTQDGRLTPIALPHALAGLWREVLAAHPGARAAQRDGVIAILTRLVLESTGAFIRVDHPIESRYGFELARAPDATRLFLDCWSELHGTSGRLVPPTPAGPLVLAGRLFAEHTFTRPFAPVENRRVTRLDAPGFPAVPDAVHDLPPPAATGEPVADARVLDALAPDGTEVCFGIDHTDSNQHVNSLVYIRVFLEAVQRRVAASGRAHALRSRRVEIAYRKPTFAGDRARAVLQLYETRDGELGACGHIVASDGKPRCYVRVALEP